MQTAKSTDKLLLWSAILIGAFLRLYRLGAQSIWGDEALTLQVYTVGHSFSQLMSNVWHRAFHPPLYFIIAHYWYMLGKSEFMLRFPSAVFGIAAIPVVYRIARSLFGPRTGAISAVVVALSPFHIWYSQEARMYSLQILLVAASMMLFLRAWKPATRWDMPGYGLVTVLGLYTQISTALLVAAQSLFISFASVRRPRRLAVWIATEAVIVIVFLPWMLHFMTSHSAIGSEGTIGFNREKSPVHIAYALYTLGVGYSLGPSVSALHFLPPRIAIMRHLPVIAVSALVFGMLFTLGLMHAHRTNRFGFWMLVTGFFVPVALVGIASLLPGVPLNPRYVIVAIVPYWIIIALGVESCTRRPVGWVMPACAMALLGVSLFNHYSLPVYAKQDVRSAVALVDEHARPGDVAIVSSIEIGGPFIYYLKRQDLPYVGYPSHPGLIDRQTLPSDMRRILAGHKRVWLVLGRTWSSDPQGILPRTFAARYPVVRGSAYQGVTVKCFDLSCSLARSTGKRIHASEPIISRHEKSVD
jgi:mannosyltransferase